MNFKTILNDHKNILIEFITIISYVTVSLNFYKILISTSISIYLFIFYFISYSNYHFLSFIFLISIFITRRIKIRQKI